VRIVLDTNVVVSAMLWRGKPFQLLTAARERRVELVCSVAMLRELGNTLSKEKFFTKVAASEQSVDQLVDGYATLLTLVRPQLIARIAPDPDDDVVIATALAAKARYIVTGDKPLLRVKSYKGIEFVSVNEAVLVLP
jgi:uncharacterized protein